MSEHDEPDAKAAPGRRRRRSLRVPVDEVPRPTHGEALRADGSATLLEMPVFEDDQRMTLHDGAPLASEPPQETHSSHSDPEIETGPLDEGDEAAFDEAALEEEALEEEALEEEALEEEALEEEELEEDELEEEGLEEVRAETPVAIEQAGSSASSVEPELEETATAEPDDPEVQVEGAPEVGLTEAEAGPDADAGEAELGDVEVESARPESAESARIEELDSSTRAPVGVEAADEVATSPVTPLVGVVVQRVVSVVSAPSSHPPALELELEPEPEPSSGELSLDIDDEDDDEPELRIGEPDASELEELDVDVDEGAAEEQAQAEEQTSAGGQASADRQAAEEQAAEGQASAEAEGQASAEAEGQDEQEAEQRSSEEAAASASPEPRDSTPELTHEEAEELLELEEAQARADAKKRPSKPPPPPRGPSKGKEASSGDTESSTSRRKKLRRNWWEELFNDDYLRTVPIPHERVIARQCDFIEQRFGLPRGATILDVGCGLGLHAVELTRRGYLVVGLDLSLPMLARAADEAQYCGFKINFLHADMREMNFDGAFDAVLCYNTTLGYFDDEGNKQVVERLYRALKPRGLLLLEVVNRDFVVRSQPNLVWFEGDGCVVMEESQMNFITSRLEVKRTVILDDGRQRDNLYTVRTYSLHELGQILHHQGFRVVEVTGWEAHPGVFFGGDSPKLIILAERRPAGPPVPPTRAGADGAESGSGEDTSSGEGRAEASDAPTAVAAAAPASSDSPASPRSAEELDAEELAEEDLETDG